MRWCYKTYGSQSRPVALTAVLWMSFIIIVFLFPLTPQPTSGDMNYTIVVFGNYEFYSHFVVLVDGLLQVGLSFFQCCTFISRCMGVFTGSTDPYRQSLMRRLMIHSYL